MCEFVSWIKNDGNIFFLTNDDLKPRKLKKYKEYNKNWREDLCGHGAIRWFYPDIIGGSDQECVSSEITYYPKEIVQAIKDYKLTKIGYNLKLLNTTGLCEYLKIQQSAYDEYMVIEQLALAKYLNIEKSALAEYEKIRQPALAEYEKIKESALAKYLNIEKSALAEYEKIRQPALDEYLKIKQPALDEYKNIKQSAFWDTFKIKNNRDEGWR